MAKKQKSPAAKSKKLPPPPKKSSPPGNPQLYTLDVFLVSGPITEEFAKANPEVSRTIQIRGDQTLEDLHNAIFDAYDRFDAHMYEFQFGNGPMEGPKYVLPMAAKLGDDDSIAGRVDQTTIESFGLKKGRAFGYWFDFGDDWMHQINVEAIEKTIPPGKYPKITKRVGKSPPQYLDEDEEP
jgi:Plasmid pRiA4b ORF-3-like protein